MKYNGFLKYSSLSQLLYEEIGSQYQRLFEIFTFHLSLTYFIAFPNAFIEVSLSERMT